MAGKSSTTPVIALRLPNEVVTKVKQRISGTGSHKTVSSYLRDRIIYDISRKHKKHKKA